MATVKKIGLFRILSGLIQGVGQLVSVISGPLGTALAERWCPASAGDACCPTRRWLINGQRRKFRRQAIERP